MRFHASSVFTNTDLGRSGYGTNPTCPCNIQGFFEI